MKFHRVYALIARHLYLYRRSLPRIMEIFYWPFLDLVIWGFITLYLAKYQKEVPGFVAFFLGALILWDMLFRSQQGITISFLEELWARNLMNLFASPLKPSEFLAATMVMSILKVTVVSVVMIAVSISCRVVTTVSAASTARPVSSPGLHPPINRIPSIVPAMTAFMSRSR